MSTKLNRRAILAGRRCLHHGHLRPFRGPAPEGWAAVLKFGFGHPGSFYRVSLSQLFSSLKRIGWRVAVPARSLACHRMGYEQLERMEQEFTAAVERAFRAGDESEPMRRNHWVRPGVGLAPGGVPPSPL